MATYRLHHKTTYAYNYPVAASHHTAILKPLDNESQHCDRFSLVISPEPTDTAERIDYFRNTSHLFSVQEPHDALVVEASSYVETKREAIDLQKLNTQVREIKEALADIKRTDLIDAKEFLYETESTRKTDLITEFGARFFPDEATIGEGIKSMLQAFNDEFEFDPEASDIYTPVEQTLSNKCGVCQDFAQLMIAALRSQGLSASYASGYILTMPPPGQPRLVGADASHAWVSIYIPKTGWVDVDPTNNLVCGDQHVVVAYGRDFSDVSMLSGAVTGGGDHTISVEVTMAPV